jgi:hypothetical protein
MDAREDSGAHLEPGDVAAYVDGALSPEDRARIEAHLVGCDACRDELRAVVQLVAASTARRKMWYLPIGIVAAAAAVTLLVVHPVRDHTAAPAYREPVVTTTVAPVVVVPRGTGAMPRSLVWTSVPHADRYRLTLFDDTGRAIWDTQATDTSVSLPARIVLQPGGSYFWKVEAQTGWNRWVSSALIRFSIDPR